jgi:hypothetical protein
MDNLLFKGCFQKICKRKTLGVISHTETISYQQASFGSITSTCCMTIDAFKHIIE